MKLVVAINKNGYIGKGDKLMWDSSEDFKHFKKLTMGGTLIVGRKTFEGCMNSVQLPGRATLVIGQGSYTKTNTEDISAQPGDSYMSAYEAMECAILSANADMLGNPKWPFKEAWVIGGKQIYDMFVPFCDEIHVSIINDEQIGDTKWEVPSDFRGEVFYYRFDPDEPKHNEEPGMGTEPPKKDEEHVDDES